MNYASWGKRFLAYLVDVIILVPFYLVAFFLGMDPIKTDAKTGAISGGMNIVYYIAVLAALAVWVYNRWIMAGKTGQTWGRKALGIKLVGEASGAPIGAGMAFVRDLAHIVDSIICYIGWLFPLWDAKKQTIGDKIMKTIVVAA